jgi:RNA methyltransferase, TrmH family
MLSKAEAKRVQSLARPRGRRESGLFLVEGVRLAEELLRSPVVPRLAVVSPSLEDTPRGAALAAALRSAVRTESVGESELRGIADTDAPQGVVVTAEIPASGLDRLHVGERSLVAVLDGIQDPGNFGTVVRSAEAFGAAAVFLLPGTVDPWNPKAVRSAAGSSMRLPLVEGEPAPLLDWLRQRRFRILGADADGVDVAALSGHPRRALVLGNEGAGLGQPVRQLLDGTVAIPMPGPAESLNVGVAAGILLYMLAREG